MLTLRPAAERGQADYGWLRANYTFSFANYYDRGWMGFRALRVINDDYVAAGRGFGEHGHDDMEILTYVLEGAIEHRDSLGSGEVLKPGEVQYMSAGTGIHHSEFNPSKTDTLHSLQIWLIPTARQLTPTYAQKAFPIHTEKNRMHLVASTDGRDGSILVHTDADLYACTLETGAKVEHTFDRFKYGWLQVVRGSLLANGEVLAEGDGAAFSQEERLTLKAESDAEFLFFDLA
jgi:redox-sensitive bicupin YhaK (pirin superfamily)